MKDGTAFLAHIRSKAYDLQSRSRNLVDDYLNSGSKTPDELAQSTARALHLYTELKNTYESIHKQAADHGVDLTLDISPFPELHNATRRDKSKVGKSNDPQTNDCGWSDGGAPGFVGSLTKVQREFWLMSELLRCSILRTWTAWKDMQWRLDDGHSTHEWEIQGHGPDIDGEDFSCFTTYNPFVREDILQGYSSQGQMTGSLSGEESWPAMLEAEQDPGGLTDTVYVHTSHPSQYAPSQRLEVPASSTPERKRRSATPEPKKPETSHVVGLDTQAGWNSNSVFGLPASTTRLRERQVAERAGRVVVDRSVGVTASGPSEAPNSDDSTSHSRTGHAYQPKRQGLRKLRMAKRHFSPEIPSDD